VVPDGARLRIATRRSALALWQAEHVRSLLQRHHGDLEVELVPVSTEGDRRLDVPLSEIGGKGVFATEVQAAVLDGRADLAVHSAKDLPARTGDGLVLAAVPERGDARDALVGGRLDDLPDGAVVATGSMRRRALLAALRPDLRFAELRGNMATRLAKADEFDAIVVAAVAFERLGLGEHLSDVLEVDGFVPQVAQGALAVECRVDDAATLQLLAAVEDPPSRRRVTAERAFLAELGGDCTLPAGAHARTTFDGGLEVLGVLADRVGGTLLRARATLPAAGDATPSVLEELGRGLAARLRDRLEAVDGGGSDVTAPS
jgi:hydroxymethylbilane synthase